MGKALILLTLFVPLIMQSDDWRLDKDKDGIKVFTREVEGFAIREFRVESSTTGSLKVIEQLFRNIPDYHSWMPDIIDASVVEQVSADIYIYHMSIGAPFPVSNRDLVTEMRFSYPADTTLRIDFKVMPDRIPEKEDHVRIRNFSGYWEFRSGDKKTLINNRFLSDPGGSVPKWLTNSFISKNPFNTVKKLKEQVE